MTKGIALLLAAGSAFAFAAPVAAQEDHGFSGPWIAGIAGYDRNQAGSSQDDGVNADLDQNAEGLVYGAAAGYDADLGTMVIGAEAELTDSTADSDYSDPYTNFGLGAVDTGRDIYVGARVGYKVTPRTLLYAKAGYTNARFNFIGTDGTSNYQQNLDTDGWRVGAGVEHKMGSNAFARLEYRYSKYSSGEIDFEASGVADSDHFNIDTDRHQVMAGVGWRF